VLYTGACNVAEDAVKDIFIKPVII